MVDSQAQVGSGSLPSASVPSAAVSIRGPDSRLRELSLVLRRLPRPVIGRICDGELLLDLRATPVVDALLAQLEQLPAISA